MNLFKRSFALLLAVLVGGSIIFYLVPTLRCFVVQRLGLGGENARLACRLNACLDGHAKRGFSGAVLVAKDGRILVNCGYGMANYEHDVPNTPKTKFRIASITKPITAVAIMQLQEQGTLRVDDLLSKYLPDYPNADRITIHHLLTHTSGMPDHLAGFDYAVRARAVSTDELIGLSKDKVLRSEPGQTYAYSNAGYALLTRIIEIASGQSYEAFLQEHIFRPAGMHDTLFDRHDRIIKDRAANYVFSPDHQKDFANAVWTEMSWISGAGGLLSTTEDLYRFDRALKAGTLLSPDSCKVMGTPHTEAKGPFTLARHNMEPGHDCYGYGLMVRDQLQVHEGAWPGSRALFLRNLVDDWCVIVLTNKVPSVTGPVPLFVDLNAILSGGMQER